MSAAVRKRLFDEQGGKCIWCLRPCILAEPRNRSKFPPDAMTIEHIIPRYRHPADVNGNIAGSCNECNWQRSCVESLIASGKDFIGRIRGLKKHQFEHILPVDICGPRMATGNFLGVSEKNNPAPIIPPRKSRQTNERGQV